MKLTFLAFTICTCCWTVTAEAGPFDRIRSTSLMPTSLKLKLRLGQSNLNSLDKENQSTHS